MIQSPIGDHAVIGDGRATALVDRGGTIDWMALPEDDRIAVFSRLVDAARGGFFALAPVGHATVQRRYVGAGPVLETVFTTTTGRVRVMDVCNLYNGSPLPWVEFARRVTGVEGTVEMTWELCTTGRLGAQRRRFVERNGLLQTARNGLRVGVVVFDVGDPTPDATSLRGSFTVTEGQRALVTLLAVVDEPLVVPDRTEIEARIDRTVHAWNAWSDGVDYSGPWADVVRRSARTLKMLIHPSGSIIAAPTTSLPEQIGGRANFDYRYCWMRDASFTIDALLAVGLVEEAHRAIVALLRAAQGTAPDLAPFYRVDGMVPAEIDELLLSGHRGSRPVRLGNGAVDQLQLGNWGDLFESVWLYVRRGNDLDGASGDLLAALADRVARIWRCADSGMWELPVRRHYTISKMGAWVALDRVLRLEAAGQLGGDVARWRFERAAIHDFVDARCWSTAKSSYTFHEDSEDLDAACVLAARTGFADPRSPELNGTIDAVRRELGDGPFVWRYTGMRHTEGAFVACSFWVAEALAEAGRVGEAVEAFQGVLDATNDLGLLSEQYDPDHGRLLGNFPQALSHLALVNAATKIHEAGRSRADDEEHRVRAR